jgi:hypothetical protein
MMKALSTHETLLNFYQTARRDDPEDSHFTGSVEQSASR